MVKAMRSDEYNVTINLNMKRLVRSTVIVVTTAYVTRSFLDAAALKLARPTRNLARKVEERARDEVAKVEQRNSNGPDENKAANQQAS